MTAKAWGLIACPVAPVAAETVVAPKCFTCMKVDVLPGRSHF